MNEIIKEVENKISAQQGKEPTAIWGAGEQLKDICRTIPGAAELVLKDLDVPEMSLKECEKKIHARADEIHKKIKGQSVCITPMEAEKIIREFYGIHEEAPKETAKKPADDFISIFDF